MKLPELLYGNNKTRRQTVAFGGVNHSENIVEGEWEDTTNLGSGRWPALSPRLGRGVFRETEGAPSALYAWEELASVEGTGFYYGGRYIGEVSAGPKQMVRVGDQIVIWPDRKYYNWKTGEFTALAVGFTLQMGLSSAVGADYVAVPQVYRDWQATDAEPETFTGNWLGVMPEARGGIKYRYATATRYRDDDLEFYYKLSGAKDQSIEEGAVGKMVLLDDGGGNYQGIEYWGLITSMTVDEREYMPGVARKYVTLHYDTYQAVQINEITKWYYRTKDIANSPVSDKLSDWSYGTTAAVKAADMDVTLGDEFYERLRPSRNVYGSMEPQEQYKRGLWPSINGKPMGASSTTAIGSRKLVEVGDLIYYDAAAGKAKMLTDIQRTKYTDHYYTTSYTLQEVELKTGAANADPETTAGNLGLRVGDPVRVSRGGVSVDTKIAGYDAEVTYSGDVPGMASAPYGIRFTDSIEAILGQTGPVSIDRVAEPDLTYICVHDNRLWGVHEGRIWCSKFGDPMNFEASTGSDADAWWTEVGSPGDWTGIVSYSGSVLAFKENLVHKVVGDLPSEFTVATYNIAGIQPGSHQSAVIVNEVLYYKGTGGVYAYSGYTPSFISENFGERKFSAAVGGTDGTRYYISMKDEDGAWQLYCFDTIRRVWLREDGLRAAAFSLHEGKLYCAAEELGKILTFGEEVEPGISWQAVSVPFYEGSFDRKQVTKLLIRAELPAGSMIRVAISYDGSPWQELYNTRAPRWRVAILPVRPKRCDSFRLRVEGEGDITLRGIARETMTGSER